MNSYPILLLRCIYAFYSFLHLIFFPIAFYLRLLYLNQANFFHFFNVVTSFYSWSFLDIVTIIIVSCFFLIIIACLVDVGIEDTIAVPCAQSDYKRWIVDILPRSRGFITSCYSFWTTSFIFPCCFFQIGRFTYSIALITISLIVVWHYSCTL